MQLFTEKGDAAKHFLIRDDVILFVGGIPHMRGVITRFLPLSLTIVQEN